MYLGGTVRSSMLATWRKSREFSVDSHDHTGELPTDGELWLGFPAREASSVQR
jgi:hypothetical protein